MVEYNTKPNNVNQSLLKKSRHRTSKPSTSSRLYLSLLFASSVNFEKSKNWFQFHLIYLDTFEVSPLSPQSSLTFLGHFPGLELVWFFNWYICTHIIITKGTSIVIIKGWMFSNWSHKVYLKPHVYKEETSATGLVSCKIG